MKLINVQEAKTHLSRLLDEAVAGQEIVIAKAGRPQVRLVPCIPEQSARNLDGAPWKGKVRMAADFDAPDERIIRMFEGSRSARPALAKAKAKAKPAARRPRR